MTTEKEKAQKFVIDKGELFYKQQKGEEVWQYAGA